MTAEEFTYKKRLDKSVAYAKKLKYFDVLTMNYKPASMEIVQLASKGLNNENYTPSKEDEARLKKFDEESDFIGKIMTAGHVVIAPTTLDILENPMQHITAQQLRFIITSASNQSKEVIQLDDRVVLPMTEEDLNYFIDLYNKLKHVTKKGTKLQKRR